MDWENQVGVVGLAAAVLTLAATLLLDFPAASLGAAVVLGSDFCGRPGFLVAVTLSFSEASVTGWEAGFGIGVGGVVALTTRPTRKT